MSDSQDIQKRAVLRHLHAFAPQDDQVDPLLVISLGRVLLKGAREGISLPDIANGDQIRHIYDWLKVEVVTAAAWLSNVDEKGRPRKLMKFGSVDQILKEADKAMLRANQRTGKAAIKEGDEEIVAELADGYTLVRMMTPAALDRESRTMQHCIGNGGYDDELGKEWARFLSLRDASGNPHVTMDISVNEDRLHINQIKGKQNAVPIAKYLSVLRPWFAEMNATLSYSPERGLMVSTNDEIYHVSELPDGFECKRDFRAHELEGARIPEGLKVHGHMSVISDDGWKPQKHLPEGLYVDGDLTIKSRFIEVISPNTRIKGDLRASSSNISEIGEGLIVFEDCHLTSTKLEKLPSKMTVIGNLLINGTKITEIGEDVIMTSLSASTSSLASLPSKTKEYEEIKIDHTPIKRLPEGLKIAKLSAAGVNFEKFPDDLIVTDELVLYRAKIPTLSDTVVLPNDAFFGEAEIGEMKGDIVFDGPVHKLVNFTNARIGKLPDSITVIEGDLILSGTDITTLPKRVTVSDTLVLRHMANLKELPDDTEVSCRTLDLGFKPQMELPDHWDVKTVFFSDEYDFGKEISAGEYRKSVRNEMDKMHNSMKF